MLIQTYDSNPVPLCLDCYNTSWLSLNETKPKPLFTNVTLKSSTKSVLVTFHNFNLSLEDFEDLPKTSNLMTSSFILRLVHVRIVSIASFLKILILNNSDYLVYLSCSWKDPFSAFVLKEMEIMKNSKKKQCFRPYGEQSAILRKSINWINPCAPLCSILAPQC